MFVDARSRLILKFFLFWLLSIPVILWFCRDGILYTVLASISLLLFGAISVVKPDSFSEWRILSGIPEHLYRSTNTIFAIWSLPLVILMFLLEDLNYIGKMVLLGGPPFIAILIYDIVWIAKSGREADFTVTPAMTLRLIVFIVFIGIMILALFEESPFAAEESNSEWPLMIGYSLGCLFIMILSYRKYRSKSRST